MTLNALRGLACVVSLFLACPTASFATTFDFSYLFNDGTLVTGSLDGTQNGNFVENLSNISVHFSDTPQSPGPLTPIYAASLDNNSTWVSGPVVSFTGVDNNFHFANYNILGAPPYNGWGFFVLGHSINGINPQATNYFGFDNHINYDRNAFDSSRWSLTARTSNSVPENGGMVLMLGIVVATAFSNRRRSGL